MQYFPIYGMVLLHGAWALSVGPMTFGRCLAMTPTTNTHVSVLSVYADGQLVFKSKADAYVVYAVRSELFKQHERHSAIY